jgi:hypothetical protein
MSPTPSDVAPEATNLRPLTLELTLRQDLMMAVPDDEGGAAAAERGTRP